MAVTFPFLQLMPELRYIIYKLLLPFSYSPTSTNTPRDPYEEIFWRSGHTSVAFTSELIYGEAIRILYGQNRFALYLHDEYPPSADFLFTFKWDLESPKNPSGRRIAYANLYSIGESNANLMRHFYICMDINGHNVRHYAESCLSPGSLITQASWHLGRWLRAIPHIEMICLRVCLTKHCEIGKSKNHLHLDLEFCKWLREALGEIFQCRKVSTVRGEGVLEGEEWEKDLQAMMGDGGTMDEMEVRWCRSLRRICCSSEPVQDGGG
ncbi:MAG: hypothetical protein MMC33_000252 [Icmadophila ericetorum]|nr:hypothetical protein [Icmadophila ericetorum]